MGYTATSFFFSTTLTFVLGIHYFNLLYTILNLQSVSIESHPSKLVGSRDFKNRYFDFDKLAEVLLIMIVILLIIKICILCLIN